ncbi:hypothetical protein GRAN_1064 [Granulicella sibirica]|uniref:Shedu protein SduA C-terminal domain-containing protein n=2 Tax=Granulicella sibirica TaxID=2479048 RepID=A0A4V1L622_9BACT|nr:hypothetical protein GRAN_1064 [Granulicella sibirica]
MAQLRAAHHLVEFMPWFRLTSYLRFETGSSLALIDAIVCSANGVELGWSRDDKLEAHYPFDTAVYLAEEARMLPDACTTRDGRKWRSLPFIIFHGPVAPWLLQAAKVSTQALFYLGFHHVYAARMMMFHIEAAVKAHHVALLSDYECCGLLVRHEMGRAQIKPALKRKHGRSNTEHYNAAGDRRKLSDWVTFSRDREGLSNDVALFEQLLSRDATETEMHKFFVQHPAILMEARGRIPLSHEINFTEPKNQKPDFVFSSILGSEDGNLDLLELKGPGERLVNRGFHAGFAHKVHASINQIRDYQRAMHNPTNLEAISKSLGFSPQNSRLAVLIGRSPQNRTDASTFDIRKREINVEIVTYDEIFESQMCQL